MFRQTIASRAWGAPRRRLQWRAEHMFRQTALLAKGFVDAVNASMEGGTYVPPNMRTSLAIAHAAARFNGGRNICSAKRSPPRQPTTQSSSLQWRAEHMFRQTCSGCAGANCSAGLQWRAEHMFRQTRRGSRPGRSSRDGFNGGRNICSAKRCALTRGRALCCALQWRAEHMFRQTSGPGSGAFTHPRLQWRAEHMFRQTCRHRRRHSGSRHRFNGGRNICSAKLPSSAQTTFETGCFNGGRNICSAKPVIGRHALGPLVASMEGGTYVPPNQSCWEMLHALMLLQWRAEHMFRQTCHGVRAGDAVLWSLQWRAEHMFRQTATGCIIVLASHRFNGGRNICSAKPPPPLSGSGRSRVLQWRAEHMFRQTAPGRGVNLLVATASMEGGTYVPPNSEGSTMMGPLLQSFNGGRNICSAKPSAAMASRSTVPPLQWRAEHMFRQTLLLDASAGWSFAASMEGGTYVPPNDTHTHTHTATGLSPASMEGGTYVPPNGVPSGHWIAIVHASMEGGTYVPPNGAHSVDLGRPGLASMEGGTYVPPNGCHADPTRVDIRGLQWRAEHMFRQTRMGIRTDP